MALGLLSCASPTPTRDLSAPVAEIDAESITAADLERRLDAEPDLKAETTGLDESYVLDTKRALLERMIAERLVDRDARERGGTLADVENQIAAQVVVTDEEVERSYRMARDVRVDDPRLQRRVQRLLAGSEQDGRERIRAFVFREKCRMELFERAIPLRQTAQVVVHLDLPRLPKQRASAGSEADASRDDRSDPAVAR